MGTGGGALQLLTLLSSPLPPPPPPHHHIFLKKEKGHSSSSQNNHSRFSSFSKAGGRVGGPGWERTRTSTHTPHGRSRYREEFDYDEDEFGFGNTRKQRTWWSDDSSPWDTDIDDDDDDDELLDGLGILEGSIGFSSIFKVLRSFGWMVPAIIVSMLLGTGTNTFAMALVLPLAQSALSLGFDMVWGRPTGSRRTKSKSHKRKRTSATATSSSRKKEEKEQSSKNGKRVDDYQSWAATNNGSAKKGEKRTQNFGGWDELDGERRMQEEPKTARANQRGGEIEGKLSKRARNRHTPLLVRLLIALFPFLGFWTKLL